MGASASVEAPDADELKRLFDKHDVTHTGKLERQEHCLRDKEDSEREAYAFIEDLRIRYGMHDVRVLSGDGWHAHAPAVDFCLSGYAPTAAAGPSKRR
eukprot:Skav213192  [mRNA]  locus=scaffold2826:135359:137147:+ [translate_table: standard]